MKLSNTSNNLLRMSITDLSVAIARRKISPIEVVEATLKQIELKNPILNAYITVTEEYALLRAKETERELIQGKIRGPLHGIPIGLKDLINTQGIKTTYAAERYSNHIPEEHAEVVKRLEAAGAIIIGKLNMHQFALGATGDRSYFGPTRNPYDYNKMTGGSSSGSGAALADFLCYGSIGSDTGGSIRIPAACCGIVGMKPTYGRVSRSGTMILSHTLDHLGPMSRDVKDNALLLNVISGFDPKDKDSIPTLKEDFVEGIELGIKGITIGVPTQFYNDWIEPEIAKIFNQVIETLRLLGAKLKAIELPLFEELTHSQQIIAAAETYVSLGNELEEAPEKLDDEVRVRIQKGKDIRASDYIKAQELRRRAIELYRNLFNKFNLILTTTIGIFPPEIGQREVTLGTKKEHARILLGRLTRPSNVIGFPCISLPGGYGLNNLPVGVQFMSEPLKEKLLYRVAYTLEQALDKRDID
jgi:aspartyl-tRNA(Asn)/glutamyl-tRNA(Gln) amidotransferase subunit A